MKLQLFSSLLLLLLLPFLAASTPTDHSMTQHPKPPHSKPPHPKPTPGIPVAFTVTASRSGSPIHLLPMNAASLSFFLGGQPATFCPLPSGCPPGNLTVFADGGSSLSVVVPGGQRIYVSPQGALMFTQAHSAFIPPGSSLGPFSFEPGPPGQPFGHYLYTGQGAHGFMACPTPDHRWQVFAALQNATVPSGNVADCLGFSALAFPSDQVGNAFQYT